MRIFMYNKLWLVMMISTACVVTSAEPKPTHKSRIVDRVCFTIEYFFILELPISCIVSVICAAI